MADRAMIHLPTVTRSVDPVQLLATYKKPLNGHELAAYLYRNAESSKEKAVDKPLTEGQMQVEISPTQSVANNPPPTVTKNEPAEMSVDEKIWARWRAVPVEISESSIQQAAASKHVVGMDDRLEALATCSISPSQSASCKNRQTKRKPLRLAWENIWEAEPKQEEEAKLEMVLEKPGEAAPPLESTDSGSSSSFMFPDAYQALPLSDDMTDLWVRIREMKLKLEEHRKKQAELEDEKDPKTGEPRKLKPKPPKPRPIFAVSDIVQDKVVEKIVAKNDKDTPFALPRYIVNADAMMKSVAYNLSLAIDQTRTADGLSRIYRLYLFPLASNIGALRESVRGAHLARRRQLPSLHITQEKCEELGFPFEPLHGYESTKEEVQNGATGTTEWKTSNNEEVSLNDHDFVLYTFSLETSVDIYLLQTCAEIPNLTGMSHSWIAGFLDMYFVTETTFDAAILIWQLSAADCVADRLRMDSYVNTPLKKRSREFWGYFFVQDEVTVLFMDALNEEAYDAESKLGVLKSWGKYKLTEWGQLKQFLVLHAGLMKFGFREMHEMIMGKEEQRGERKTLDFESHSRFRRDRVQTAPTVWSEGDSEGVY